MTDDGTDEAAGAPRELVIDAKPAPGDASDSGGSAMAPVAVPVIAAGFLAKYVSLAAGRTPRVRAHPPRNALLDGRSRRSTPFDFVSRGHDSDTFIELLDVIYPPGRGHIIMDNLATHDTPDVNEWFDEHRHWTRHITPKHASWLNQIECWFSILGRHVLDRGSFAPPRLDAYVASYLETDQPFRWSYRPTSWRRCAGECQRASGHRDLPVALRGSGTSRAPRAAAGRLGVARRSRRPRRARCRPRRGSSSSRPRGTGRRSRARARG